jgi:hypothetical protein
VGVGVDLVLDLGEQFGLLEVVDLLEPENRSKQRLTGIALRSKAICALGR